MFLPGNHNLQMSSCLSSGGRAYAFELEIIKSPSPASTSTTARASNAAAASAAAASSSSSPSSTLSESSNSGLAITTRKPRTPRKRPNQTYNEAAALLATAYPNLFPAAATNTSKLAKSTSDAASSSSLSDDSAELFFPFRGVADDEYSSSFLLLPERLNTRFRPKLSCASPGEIESRPSCHSGAVELSCEYHDGEDFDADSMLDEEVDEGGIDSIMGNLSVKSEPPAAASAGATTCYGYPMGLGLGLGFGVGIGVRALRRADEGNWWSFPAVDMVELSPRLRKPAEKGNGAKKKKMKKVEREKAEVVIAAAAVEPPLRVAVAEEKEAAGLLLKLNYDGVLNAWSDKGSPFSDEAPGQDAQGNDVAARLAQIDLFPAESGGLREASVLRYKEKRRTRLFSKKIRYQVRKVNADRRPRMKGRFVRRPNSKHDDYDER